MSLQVIGTGVGRTGTYSLKLALTALDLGPCHHMEEVLLHMPTQLPLWQAALQGKSDFDAIYQGCRSAVDWPTAGFFRELAARYPEAKFVHTTRSPESWAASFSETIDKVIAGKDKAPPEMHAWLEMAARVVGKTGFSIGAGVPELSRAFAAHTEAVKATVPSRQLLIFDVKDGWAPLCEFLGVPAPAPDKPFPRTNTRAEFWERLSAKT